MFVFLSVVLLLTLVSFGGVEPHSWRALSLLFTLGFVFWTLDEIRQSHTSGHRTDLRFAIVGGLTILLAAFVDPKLALGPMAGVCAWMALQRGESLVRFLQFLLAAGLLEAMLGLFQYFVAPGWIFGYLNEAYVTSGTLINRNHFAGLLGMLIPVALGLAYLSWVRHRDAARAYVFLLCGSIMGLAAIFSLSRMGIFSLLLTLVFLGMLVGLHSLRLGSAFLLVPLCLLLGGAFWVGTDVVVERFDRLIGPEGTIQDARTAVFQDTLRMIADNPMGVGPGAYADMFRPYQTEHNELLFTHAHNDYLETVAEWGIPIAAIFWIAIFTVFGSAIRALADTRDPEKRGPLIAALGAMFYILMHSLTDFNLQIPSNAMLFFAFAGIVLAQIHSVGKTRTGRPLSSWPRRAALAVPALALSAYAVSQAYGPFLAAWITRSESGDPAIYEQALRYDPDNADYHFSLAQIHHLSVPFRDVESAHEHYAAAAQLNRKRSGHWLWLSKLLEQQGEAASSRDAMAQALATDPNNAATHWAAANLYVRLGDLPAADAELARTADLDAGYFGQVLDLAWRLYEDPVAIMAVHVPETRMAHLTALRYFVNRESEAGAALAWERLRAFETESRERLAYVDYLIRLGRPHEAYGVFAAAAEQSGSVFNGGFEHDPINGGFDWRYSTGGPAAVLRDTTLAAEGLASLRLEFNGEENPDFSGLWHWLVVDAGQRYEMTFSMRTEGLSTDEGVYVEVDGQRSEALVGTTYWKEFSIPFIASSDLVRVRVRRNPTQKFDNRFSGRVWLDDFQLNPGPATVAFR